jgi:hypothetical protein
LTDGASAHKPPDLDNPSAQTIRPETAMKRRIGLTAAAAQGTSIDCRRRIRWVYAPVADAGTLFAGILQPARVRDSSAALGNWALFRGPAVKVRQHSVIVDRATLLRSTVVMHLRSIHEKLGVHSRGELIAALQPA